jgi:hypothetical protein
MEQDDNDGLIAGLGIVGLGIVGGIAWFISRGSGSTGSSSTVPSQPAAAFDGDYATEAPTVPATNGTPDEHDESDPATGEGSLARDIALTGELPSGNDVAARVGLVNQQQENDVESGFTGL